MGILRRHGTKLIIGATALTTAIAFRKEIRSLGRWFAELATACPPPRPRHWSDASFLVIGHRGAAGTDVENTIPSFEEALRQGANALEIDLSMTADGEIVVWHDWDPNAWKARARELGLEEDVLFKPRHADTASGCRRSISGLTLREFRDHFGYAAKRDLPEDHRKAAEAIIPTFDEFIAWAADRPRLRFVFLDIKAPLEEATLASRMIGRIETTLRALRPSFRVAYLFTDADVCSMVCREYAGRNLSFDLEPPPGIVLRPSKWSSVDRAIRHGLAFASLIHPKVSTFAPWITTRRIARHDIRMRDRHNAANPDVPIDKLLISTINEEDEMRCLIGMGIDGIITDCPTVLRRAASSMGRAVDGPQSPRTTVTGSVPVSDGKPVKTDSGQKNDRH